MDLRSCTAKRSREYLQILDAQAHLSIDFYFPESDEPFQDYKSHIHGADTVENWFSEHKEPLQHIEGPPQFLDLNPFEIYGMSLRGTCVTIEIKIKNVPRARCTALLTRAQAGVVARAAADMNKKALGPHQRDAPVTEQNMVCECRVLCNESNQHPTTLLHHHTPGTPAPPHSWHTCTTTLLAHLHHHTPGTPAPPHLWHTCTTTLLVHHTITI
ncbi:hypothetical protein FHG87_014610 [Trinorchestia longiramus]|nr:hypothetical protein FHG87_014610 [Trinorchestia longiramus]